MSPLVSRFSSLSSAVLSLFLLGITQVACTVGAAPDASVPISNDVQSPMPDVADVTMAPQDAVAVDDNPEPIDVPPPRFVCARALGDGGLAMMSDAGLMACNGSPSLCSRRYDQVSYATTHNAFATEAENFGAANQYSIIPKQLQDGVRGLMLDAHYDRGRTYLCHGLCSLGRRLLAAGLCDIRQFLDSHPAEVVTIIFESYVRREDIVQAFDEAQLLDTVLTHNAGEPWPTLATMIASGRRLVVFTDREGGSPSWHHDVWANAWETPFSARTPMDLDTCMMNRGVRTNSLFILNHFLTDPLASPALARMVNNNPLLLNRARRCQQETGSLPNFVTVDYYEIGDLFATVNALNGL